MTKHELMKLVEPLDDDAFVFIRVVDDDGNTIGMSNDIGYETVVTGDKYQNEITLVATVWDNREAIGK